jgi:hypothetical protein
MTGESARKFLYFERLLARTEALAGVIIVPSLDEIGFGMSERTNF